MFGDAPGFVPNSPKTEEKITIAPELEQPPTDKAGQDGSVISGEESADFPKSIEEQRGADHLGQTLDQLQDSLGGKESSRDWLASTKDYLRIALMQAQLAGVKIMLNPAVDKIMQNPPDGIEDILVVVALLSLPYINQAIFKTG